MTKPDAKAIAKIAEVMHETVRAWQKANGQSLAPPWSRAPKWMKEASIASVKWRMENPNAPVSAQHDQWMLLKTSEGWKHGKAKSGTKKTHPMLVPYSELPEIEKRKDALVNAVIDSLARPMS
ncbi:MAG: RyR domain-containing protein [Hyphomonadaceae bacterium]